MPSLSFQTLFEVPGLPRFDLPEALEATYGRFGLPEHVVYANFVSSVDGIAAIPNVARSSALISGGNPADRFVVALLRAAADAVVIGAGTFRAHSGPWTAQKAYPDAAAHFVEFRRRQGAAPEPMLVVVTGSGHLQGSGSKLWGAIVATTSQAADRAREQAGDAAEVVPVGETGPIEVRGLMGMLSARGFRRILTEGGPKLMGELLRAGAVDELFLTLSPVLVGGSRDHVRQTLAAGVDLLPAGPLAGRLTSVRSHGSYLFLRYELHPESLPRTGRAVRGDGDAMNPREGDRVRRRWNP
ncbi:MAG: dihydrofolate reductase family protein [Actinomycetota bacterium]